MGQGFPHQLLVLENSILNPHVRNENVFILPISDSKQLYIKNVIFVKR